MDTISPWLPEDNEVHASLVGLVVFVETEFSDRVEVIDVLDLCVDPVVYVKVRVHVIAEHQTAEVFLRRLNEGEMNALQYDTIRYNTIQQHNAKQRNAIQYNLYTYKFKKGT